MNPPFPSLLVLAWDDADPSIGPAGLPPAVPTLPLVQALAAAHPLLALLPQLPAALRTEAELAALPRVPPPAPGAALPTSQDQTPAAHTGSTAAEPTNSQETSPEERAETTTPPPAPPAAGVWLVPASGAHSADASAAAAEAAPTGQAGETTFSRIVGLGDLDFAAGSAAGSSLLASFTWHSSAGSWQAPAAPYLGSSLPSAPPAPAPEQLRPNPPAAPGAAQLSGSASEGVFLHLHTELPTNDLRFDPDPELPVQAEADKFDQTAAELGPAEAADLAAYDDDQTPDQPPLPAAPPARTVLQAQAALRRPDGASAPTSDISLSASPAPNATTEAAPAPPATELAAAPGLSDDLHYRIIQYARFATHLTDAPGEEFGVIYAPNWPAWLAALEIRYRSRRPLVLHLTELALHTATPAERGWRLELERYALRRAHTVLVATEALRQQVLAGYYLRPERVRVVAPHDATAVQQALADIGGLFPNISL